MKYFDAQNGLGDDQCALVSREVVNKSVNDYNLWNMYFTSDCKADNQKMQDMVFDNPNLRFKDGYGFTNACVVDMDSALRNDKMMTNDRTKTQLCVRWNKAAPDLGRGGFIPGIDSALKNGEDTSLTRACDKLTETDYDRFIPLTGCLANTIQNANHIILPFTRGGDITRNYVHSNAYLEKCGFQKSSMGNFYQKPQQNQTWGPIARQQNQPMMQRPAPTQ